MAQQQNSSTDGKAPDAKTLLSLIETTLEDGKAENIVVVDLDGKSSVADFLVIASGRAARHVSALSDQVLQTVKQAGMGRVATEGLSSGDWVLLDVGDVIVHLFRPEVREFYNLEKIWLVDAEKQPAKT
ncbi:Ribosomal silencing factor RsfA [hydrothermal vent metagenome]|uniref:Ribosomal silencing factor RsfA n=1 Tax=hydrothermal vent metagenome TaxID=652676 RepID=A0A3B0R2V8_9ZZZZ